jgi:hypothetical protein
MAANFDDVFADQKYGDKPPGKKPNYFDRFDPNTAKPETPEDSASPAGPWSKHQSQPAQQAASGPWSKFDPSTATPEKSQGDGNYFNRFDAAFSKGDWKPQEPSKPTGIFDTFVEGAKSTGRALGATADTVTNDSEGVVQAAQAQRAAPKAEPLEKFYSDIAARKEAAGEDPGL